ncbi:MAG: hypothetical protein JWN74_3195 [Acidobacteriaceae bacterium]|nr:hypothetical protein [Acidobacteriaceae bacterium]
MFGNRKRKPQEEESLVPHGLVWYATAEPAAEENVKNEESLGHTVQYAQVIEQARRPQPAPEAAPGPQAVPQPPIPASASLPWWRTQQSEPEPDRPIVKPILMPLSAYAPPPPVQPSVEPPRVPQVPLPRISAPQVSSPPVSPPHVQVPQVLPANIAQIVQRPVPPVPVTRLPAPVQAAHVQTTQVRKPAGEVRKPNVQNSPPAVPKIKRNSEALSRGVTWLRASSQDALRTATSILGGVRGRWLQVSRSVELRKSVLRAGEKGQDLLRRGVAGTRSYAQTSQSTILNLSRAGLEHLKRMSARGRSVSAAGTKHSSSAMMTQRFNSQRIRTAFAVPVVRAKTLLAQPMLLWKTKRDSAAIDSRFWTSMTLAAISALIVLGIVSVVPNYAAKSLPSRILSPNSSANANVAEPVVLAAPPQAGPSQTSKPAAKKTVNPKPAQVKPASPKAAVPPKAHRTADDDYIAPDTYKYYGNGSKRSR